MPKTASSRPNNRTKDDKNRTTNGSGQNIWLCIQLDHISTHAKYTQSETERKQQKASNKPHNRIDIFIGNSSTEILKK